MVTKRGAEVVRAPQPAMRVGGCEQRRTFTRVRNGVRSVLALASLVLVAAQCRGDTAPTAPIDVDVDALWNKYGWTKPTSAAEIVSASTAAFGVYVATTRTPAASIQVLAQTGVDTVLISWIDRGANLVARAFSYPPSTRPFVDLVAIDSAYLVNTYRAQGFSANEVSGLLTAFKAGAPAFGGRQSNTWNYRTILTNNLMVNDRIGMAQTAGHEFFHSIQERSANTNPCQVGSAVPCWFWEGPAMFIGLQTASHFGFADFASQGHPQMISRFQNGPLTTRSLLLSGVTLNNGTTLDPYAIGEVATEFLVANVGVAKFVAIYSEIGTGKSLAAAFMTATGVELADFYSMFEQIRGVLGVPRA